MKKLFPLIALLFLTANAQAQLSVVQSASISADGTVSSVTTGNITTTTGNLIVCNFSYWGVADTTPVTDSKTNSYVDSVSEVTDIVWSDAHIRQMYVANATGGSSHNFTFTFSGTGNPALDCLEISGAQTSGTLDKVSSLAQDVFAGQPRSSGTTSPTVQPSEILIGACNTTGNDPTNGFTSPGTWTNSLDLDGDGDTMGLTSAYRIVSATGSFDYAPNIDQNSNQSICLIATYKAVVTAGTTAQTRRRF